MAEPSTNMPSGEVQEVARAIVEANGDLSQVAGLEELGPELLSAVEIVMNGLDAADCRQLAKRDDSRADNVMLNILAVRISNVLRHSAR